MTWAAGFAVVCFAGPTLAQIQGAVPAAGIRLASPPVVKPGVVQTVTNSGNSAGRETFWIQRGIVGGQPQQERRRLAWDAKGPAYYGAAEDDFSRAWVQNNNALITISPWIDQNLRPGPGGGMATKLDLARQQWLRDRGYIGAVRGVRNPLADADRVAVRDAGVEVITENNNAIEPRAIFRVPAEATKFRKEMMVRLGDQPAGGDVERISTPFGHAQSPALLVAVNGQLRPAGAVETASEENETDLRLAAGEVSGSGTGEDGADAAPGAGEPSDAVALAD